MNDIAIHIEDLGKRYRIGAREDGNKTLREAIVGAVKAPLHNLRRLRSLTRFDGAKDDQDIIWALRDICLDIKQGEVVGIIGPNGAGKSTLLKVLSRITEPSTGFAEMDGRVSSLLEVGTGFHPELTGRENVYLNGTVLGMRKKEIDRKFDEIVDFSGVEKFINTPVKRYSSGMQVRLAFSVAAHLDPEILIIDEVLAVGDAAFQKKCLGKMNDVAKGGRTILFVSHNMQAIRSLCPRSVLLDAGKLVVDDSTERTLSLYNQRIREKSIDAETDLNNQLNRRGSGAIRFTDARLEDTDGNPRFDFAMGQTVRFRFSYRVFEEMRGLAVQIGLRSGLTSEIVTTVRHVLTTDKLMSGKTGTCLVELPDIFIRPGEYPLYLYISESSRESKKFDVLDDLIAPLVVTAGQENDQSEFDPLRPVGYFSLPSRLLFYEENDV